ncbi:nuclear transport factor 2 family protein [Phenylobacterium sp.]|uniref:nuclear transport factor 2 family protein n=1 Tax=Phenylobacterium sp. TaxID=1871053 RepID=UPI0035B09FC3
MAEDPEIRRTLERYADAWRAGDFAAMTACYADDFVLHYGGRNALSGDHLGKAEAVRVLVEFTRRTGRRLVAIVDVLAGGAGRGSIIAREAFGDAEVERVLVYRVAEGRLAECWVLDADQPLIDRLVGEA